VDHRAVLGIVNGCTEALLADQLRAYGEFDQVHASRTDATLRLSVEGSRPKWVNDRLNYFLEMRYGKRGPIRMITQGQLRYLFIEGDEFNLGIRAKKVDEHWRSSNHDSAQQDELRTDGLFKCWDIPTYHFVLGYRDSGGLQPEITHVGITWEHKVVEMIRLLWTKSQGVIPFAQEIQPNLDMPPLPKPTTLRRRRKPGDSDDKPQKKQG